MQISVQLTEHNYNHPIEENKDVLIMIIITILANIY